MFRTRLAVLALVLSPLASITPAQAHGSHGGGGETLEAGEFDFTPLITIEGHLGYDNNLEIKEEHQAVDFLIGGEWAWGLGNDKQFSLSAFVGPTLVEGEAEHFYGEIHVEEHGEEEEEEHGAHPTRNRVDLKAFFAANYKHSDRLDFQVYWNPYLVTSNESEFHADENEWERFESKGIKNEIGAKGSYAFGDGDVDLGLGDSFSDLIDGTYFTIDHRQGWDVKGVFIGNYTDTRLGVGFNYGATAFQIEAGPRFYTPGSYANLDQRTDFASELMVTRPLSDNVDLFAHWKLAYTGVKAEGWGKGCQHHLGAGVTFKL